MNEAAFEIKKFTVREAEFHELTEEEKEQAHAALRSAFERVITLRLFYGPAGLQMPPSDMFYTDHDETFRWLNNYTAGERVGG